MGDQQANAEFEPMAEMSTEPKAPEKPQTPKTKNPHEAIAGGPSWITGRNKCLSLVHGDYSYYHYGQDGVNDNGWGCCYRSIQTVTSWYKLNAHTEQPPPSIEEIQTLLQEKDELSLEGLEIGSPTWIGTVEGGYILNWYLGYECKTIYLRKSAELRDYDEVLARHFEQGNGPVIMGVGKFAYTLAGICIDASGKKDSTGYLVVDPHYNASVDDLQKISKAWVLWRKIDFFNSQAKGSFINLCLPTLVKV